jgi:hypothetical protein
MNPLQRETPGIKAVASFYAIQILLHRPVYHACGPQFSFTRIVRSRTRRATTRDSRRMVRSLINTGFVPPPEVEFADLPASQKHRGAELGVVAFKIGHPEVGGPSSAESSVFLGPGSHRLDLSRELPGLYPREIISVPLSGSFTSCQILSFCGSTQ